jgi:alpha-glucosidase
MWLFPLNLNKLTLFNMRGFTLVVAVVSTLATMCPNRGLAAGDESSGETKPAITRLDPPEKDFFSKELICHGIPIKAPDVVADQALYVAYDRMSMELKNLPMVVSNLVTSGVEVHIIGQHQVTSDLPEHRHLKGKPLPEYNGLTVDQRTRGLGGRLVSCGEENLLKLEDDHYYGRDILVHEFAHAIRQYGVPLTVVQQFNEQRERSLAKGLWKGAYSGSNGDEFFAEMTMWYFGTHGDLHMTGPKPENGPEGLRKYDPETYQLFDDFYSGRIKIEKMERGHAWTSNAGSTNRPPQAPDSED